MTRDRRQQRRNPLMTTRAGSPGGGAVFSPSSLSSLFAWYRSDLEVTTSNITLADVNDFTTASWTRTGVTVTANDQTDPLGGSTADTITNTATTNAHVCLQTASGNPQTSGYVESSIYAKAGTANFLRIHSGVGGPTQVFNLATGALGTSVGSPVSTIVSQGSGWYLCTMRHSGGVAGVASYGVGESDTTGNYLGTVKNIYFYTANITQPRVSNWADQEGTRDAVQATDANMPSLHLTGELLFNSNRSIKGDGTADRLPLGGVVGDWKFLHDGTGCSVWMVMRVPPANTDGTLLDSGNVTAGSSGFSFYHQAAGSPLIRATNGTTSIFTYSGTAFSVNTTYQVLVTHSTAAGYVIRRNGIELSSGAYSAAASSADPPGVPMLFDTTTVVGNWGNWSIAELAICNSVISTGDITSLESYGAARYGL